MKFNVSGLLQEPTGATRSYTIEAPLEIPGHETEQVTGEVEFLRTPAGVLVRAHLSVVEPESCSRCLKPLDEKVNIDFEEEFQSVIDPRTGQPLAGEERDPEAFLIDERHILDLNEAVRQYREVSLLMQPLCSADCRGLCPRCGADLNQGECGCEPAPVDSRWAELAALRGGGLGEKD